MATPAAAARTKIFGLAADRRTPKRTAFRGVALSIARIQDGVEVLDLRLSQRRTPNPTSKMPIPTRACQPRRGLPAGVNH